MGCDADDECLAEIAGALGVDEILTGKLSEEADGRMMVLKRIDQRRAQIVRLLISVSILGMVKSFFFRLGPSKRSLRDVNSSRYNAGVSKKAVLRLNPPPIKSRRPMLRMV